MMILPDDTLHIVIDTILPDSINTKLAEIYEEYTNYIGREYDNGWKPEYTLYALLDRMSNKHNISIKIIYDALVTLLTLRNTNTILRHLVGSKCKYDIPTLLKQYLHIFKDRHRQKMINVHSDILHHSKYISSTHCNSGCINCAAYLPCWWPSLTKDLTTHIPDSEILLWEMKTDTYIRDGCCSFECYRETRPADHSDPYNTLLQLGQRRELFCYGPDCDKSINPVDAAAFHIKFCNEDCKYAYEKQSNYRAYSRQANSQWAYGRQAKRRRLR
jgi:hypothetical protein